MCEVGMFCGVSRKFLNLPKHAATKLGDPYNKAVVCQYPCRPNMLYRCGI